MTDNLTDDLTDDQEPGTPGTRRDRVYDQPRSQIVDFAFDRAVAEVFPDMIRRSVPGYELVVPMTGLLAARHICNLEHALVYDLGCSLGATTLAVLHALNAIDARTDVEIRAVDAAPSMLEKAAASVRDPRVTFIEAQVQSLQYEPCSVILMNYLLQFVAPAQRLALLQRLQRSLAGGGMLVVSEKIRLDDPAAELFSDAAHLDFKRANGYSELEISQKRTALEQVMIIDSVAAHLERFDAAGFASARVWFQCLNWVSFVVFA